ncbi:alpha/beta fold hydrolase [Roseospira goensis]|uniref:Pimeloyl-ACP methyl ester carboxylesterase n=1 Tax=Roseospira goensis TaxID=391922 RepID=A0A7W6WL87_9PROT|nr:alpha/beta hydrolase [Roseospira goensis]MBB4286890.1 pimeloyl-ACP methyl ester carboxylesterase [Roseospira goensis]
MTPPARLERRIALGSGGPRVYLRGLWSPAGARAGGPPPVLCVHGSTYPGHVAFDLPLDGLSWLDVLAAGGRSAWCVDLPGYGRADRPLAMDRPAHLSPPLTRTDEAVAAVAAARDAVLAETGQETVALLGWSWGTTICAALAAQEPDRVDRLVLWGPQWFPESPTWLAPGSTAIGAYRLASLPALRTRRFRGVPEAERAALVPPAWLDAWETALLDSDPAARDRDPPAIRAPNGTIEDSLEYWCVGEAPYDPARIRAPTLVVVGEWDRETPPDQARGLFEALHGASVRRLVVLGRAGHWAMLDRRRRDLFHVVQGFLDEPLEEDPGV